MQPCAQKLVSPSCPEQKIAVPPSQDSPDPEAQVETLPRKIISFDGWHNPSLLRYFITLPCLAPAPNCLLDDIYHFLFW